MIKKFTLAIIFFACCALTSDAQYTFYKSYQTNGSAAGQAVLQVNGGYVVAGVAANPAGDSSYVFLLKANGMGDTLWTRTYRLKKVFYITFNSPMQQMADGGFIITGFARNTNQNDSLVLMKTDSIGNVVWTRLAGDFNTVLAGECIQQTLDGGYIVSGQFYKLPGALYILLMKLDATGTTQWSKAITVDYDAEGTSVKPTSDGGYIITGQAGWRIFLVKTNATGQVMWSTIYPTGAPYDVAYTVLQTADGGYVLCGMNSIDSSGVSQIILFKTNNNGDLQWSYNYFGSSSFVISSSGAACINTSDGGFAICGYVTQMESAENFTCLLKTDSLGVLQWNRTFGTVPGINIGCHSLMQTSDGAYVITGNANAISLIRTDNQGQIWCSDSALSIITTATTLVNGFGTVYDSTISCGTSNPEVITGSGMTVVEICAPTAAEMPQQSPAGFSIYPNPARQSFSVLVNDRSDYNGATISVFNIPGNLIYSRTLQPGEKELELNLSLNTGIYFVKLCNNERSAVQKVIIE